MALQQFVNLEKLAKYVICQQIFAKKEQHFYIDSTPSNPHSQFKTTNNYVNSSQK